jgi:hypothetical protein
MPIRVYYEVLNQKGTPALYSDNFASRPAAGYVGRIFNSPDTGQIFYDTGTTWTLLADAGVGSGSLASVCANGNTTATGIQITAGGLSTNSLTSTNLTAGSMPFIGTGGLFSQDNANFFWDNTNKRLGIRTNTPSVELDLHSTANVQIHLNNTSTADSKIAFLNASVGKWRIGNLYSGGANLFHIYNNTGATLAMQIDSTNAALFYGNLSSNGFLAAANGVTLTNGGTTTTAGATNIGGLTAGLNIALASGFNQTLTFPTGVGYTYTFPSATGTLALTSNLGGTTGYLPKYASGTSLGQSLFYDNGTAAYIGATSGGNGLFNAIASSGYGIDVAGYVKFRADLGVGAARQLEILCGGGNEVYFNTSGYGAGRSTLMVFQTTNGASVNTNQLVLDQNGLVIVGSTASGSTKFQVNGTSYFSSNVGIGTNNPTFKLEVRNDIAASVNLAATSLKLYNGSDGGTSIEFTNSVGASSKIQMGVNSTGAGSDDTYIAFNTGGNATSSERWRVDYLGNFIGATANYLRLTGNNGMYFAVGSTITGALGGSDMLLWNDTNSGGIVVGTRSTLVGVSLANGATSWGAYSDERLKTNIENIDSSLDKLMTLRTIKYHLKDIDQSNDKKRIGIIAQDLLGKFEEVLDIDRNGLYQVRYSELVPVLIKGTQELNTRLTNVEEALLTLQQNLN